MKVNWYPLTSVWDQSSPKLTSTLFAGLPYARNRSLGWDLFCGGSSARLPTTSHAHKMDSRPGIVIYATSHDTDNTIANRMIKTRKQKWDEKQLCGYFKRLINNISRENLDMAKNRESLREKQNPS